MQYFVATILLISTVISAAKTTYQTRKNISFSKLLNLYETKTFNPKSQMEDSNLLFPELVKKYNYPVESHIVVTDDGYNLNIHRIPHGKNSSAQNRPLVFLQHGILASSTAWIIPGPKKSLGYLLADRGYDVWFGNTRGNQYSRAHSYFDVESKEFWNFTWHEIGVYDLPAMVDYALKTTGQKNLFYIGHSQGTTSFYVMASERPEYNVKIRAHFSLAPIAYMNHMVSPLLKFISLADGGIDFLLKSIGVYEFLPNDSLLHDIAKPFCKEGLLQVLCTNSLFVLCGYNENQTNTTLVPIFMGHLPAGGSTKQFLHYAQVINSGKFRQWDYGLIGNNIRYGSWMPPDYILSKVTAPVYLFYSHNDWLAAEVDVSKLYNELGNSKGKILISDDKWNHLDYIFGIDAVTLVYNNLFKIMRRH